MGAGKRLLTGESLFMTVFTHTGSGKAHVAFGAPYPGNILPVKLSTVGGCLICQKDSYLCAAKGVSISIYFQRKILTGLFGGEGFIMQKLEGSGMTFLHAGGTVMERQLSAGETLHVDTGCIVAFEPSVQFDIQQAGNIKTALFGGEGLFFAVLQGPGKVWLQSLPFSRLAGRMLRAAPQRGGSSEEGSVLGSLVWQPDRRKSLMSGGRKAENQISMKKNDIQNDDIDPALGGLRQDIDAIDAQIVSLLVDRQHVVRHVAAMKKARNLPVYHPAREEDLISRRRQQAKDTGLDPDFIEEIYRTIIRRSRVTQTRTMAMKSVRPEGVVLLVGGKGGMGRYFEACFRRAGYQVRFWTRKTGRMSGPLCDGYRPCHGRRSHRCFLPGHSKHRPLSAGQSCSLRYHQHQGTASGSHAESPCRTGDRPASFIRTDDIQPG